MSAHPSARTADPEFAVRTVGLTKRFAGPHAVVDDLRLEVPPGTVFGFLGPNGSGKTTTIRMLLGLVEPTSGTTDILGRRLTEDTAHVLSDVGAIVEGPAFHPFLSGRDNLRRVDDADAGSAPDDADARITAALDRVGLLSAAGKRYRAYSLGMRQRLAIAANLLRPRRLLILDEPTNGLDPQGTREVRALLCDLAADGVTVVLSTHLLSEVEQICGHVAVMHRGRLVAQGRLDDLTRSARQVVRVETNVPESAADALRALGMADVSTTATDASAPLDDLEPEKVLASVVGAGVPVRGFSVSRPGLEELFVGLTGEGFDVSG